MARWFLLGSVLCGLCFLCPLVGCSGSKPAPVSIKGTVDLDGKPLPEGKITLIDEAGAPETFDVKDGKFEGQAKLGKKTRVEITGLRPGSPIKMGDKTMDGPPENYLPERFNTKSKITAEVTADGITPATFEVKAK